MFGGVRADIKYTYPNRSTASKPLDWRKPTKVMTGFVTRGIDPAKTTMRGYATGVILDDLDSRDFMKVRGRLDNEAIDTTLEHLDWCQNNQSFDGYPLQALLRIGWGYQSPELWTRRYVAYGRDGTNATMEAAPSNPDFRKLPYGGVPFYWEQGFWDLYEEFHALLADTDIPGHPACVGFASGLNTTQFTEWSVKQYALLENRVNADAVGWTAPNDLEAYYRGAQIHKKYLQDRWGSMTHSAFNPSEIIKYPKDGSLRFGSDIMRTLTAMAKFREITTGFGILANNGFKSGDEDNPMYRRQREYRNVPNQASPLSYQTRTLGKHQNDYNNGNLLSTVPLSLQKALDYKALWVELPSGSTDPGVGPQYVSPALAASLVPQFRILSQQLIAA